MTESELGGKDHDSGIEPKSTMSHVGALAHIGSDQRYVFKKFESEQYAGLQTTDTQLLLYTACKVS